jgi:hypothetical protein
MACSVSRAFSAISAKLPKGWGDLGRQILILVGVDLAYTAVRGIADGERAVAMAHGQQVIDFERSTHTFFEPSVQAFFLPAQWVIDLANQIYLNAQFSVALGFLVWLYLFRNDAFYFVRNMFMAAMAFALVGYTLFPTETHEEALDTLDFLGDRRDQLAVYIVGEFGLTHGSLVAQDPSRFGIRETWELEGDHLGLGIFFAPEHPWKSDDERADVDDRLEELSSGWALRTYPWAGAVSTAHTILYYDHFGSSVFRDLAERGLREGILGAKKKPFEAELRFDPRDCARAEEREGAIWAELVNDKRIVGRAPYERLAAGAPSLRPRPIRIAFVAGEEPAPVARPKRAKVRGRRPSHSSNATRS